MLYRFDSGPGHHFQIKYTDPLNPDGSVVAIGAYGNGDDLGHTRIYTWNGATWLQFGADIDGGAVPDRSGFAVSLNMDGSKVAIGASYNNEGTGYTRIFALGDCSNDTCHSYFFRGWRVNLSVPK